MIGPAVLGFCSGTHDSAAALIVDNQLRGFAEEERLNGEKHTKQFPALAVQWLLDSQQLPADTVGAVAYNFTANKYLTALRQLPRQLLDPATRPRAIPRARSFAHVAARTRARTRDLGNRFPRAQVWSTLHHYAHGLYAFASSGYDEAAVLVTDSLGEVQATTVGHALRRAGHGCGYRILDAGSDPASLGYAYGAITEHLGWRRSDEEGTVMALAAHGDPARFRDLIQRAIIITDTGFALDPKLFALRVISRRFPRVTAEFAAATCPPRPPDAPIEQTHRDLAAALQQRTEQVMLHLARRARALTSAQLLCVSGGVAANCVAIGKIVEAGIFDEVHVPPAPGDSGTAIGAALAANLAMTGRLADNVVGRAYLGPAWPDLALPPTPRPGLSATRPAGPAAEVLAQELARGQIVGLFRGALEAGPRALGNRSILASPLDTDIVDKLNATVKFREPFRPFAPVTLAATAPDWFTLPQLSPYMSIAAPVTDAARDRIPAVVHANGTARVQTVTSDSNPFLAEVIGRFAALTGVPVLINTSLNVKGKPICGSPDMALDCLIESGLDALLIEGWLVRKC
ncbi:carbamoyltransferase [Nocardia sp. NPDC059246]|uniref:carbamoyltransferase family protein n=1 Tax=unclassified Nocardia TaxID=2637762 RepID=UPI0036A60EA6